MSQALPDAYVPTSEALAFANSMHDHKGGPAEALFCAFNLEQDLAHDKRMVKSGVVAKLEVNQVCGGVKVETENIPKKVFACSVPIKVNPRYSQSTPMTMETDS